VSPGIAVDRSTVLEMVGLFVGVLVGVFVGVFVGVLVDVPEVTTVSVQLLVSPVDGCTTVAQFRIMPVAPGLIVPVVVTVTIVPGLAPLTTYATKFGDDRLVQSPNPATVHVEVTLVSEMGMRSPISTDSKDLNETVTV